MLPILILLALAWGILAWRKPKFAVLVLPALLPAYLLRTKIGPLPTTLLELVWISTLIGATVGLGKDIWLKGFENARPWRWALVLWSLATAVAVAVAPDHIAALGLWRAYILEPIAYFILLSACLKDNRDRRLLITSLLSVTFFVTLWAIFQYATGLGIPHPWDTSFLTRRATGPFPYPNALSLFCAPLAALFFGLAINNHRPERSAAELKDLSKGPSTSSGRQYLLWLGFFAAVLSTLLAKSVGGSLAILSAVSFLLIWNKKTRLPAISAIILGLAIVFAVPQIRAPVVKNLTFQDWSGRVRVWMWQESWDMLKDRPILGAGLGAYPEVFKPYHKKTFIEIFQYPHNIILNLWSETGLLGITAFLLIVVTWIRLVLKKKTGTAVYLLPLIAILVQGLVDVPYFKNDLAILFWIFACLASSPSTFQEKEV